MRGRCWRGRQEQRAFTTAALQDDGQQQHNAEDAHSFVFLNIGDQNERDYMTESLGNEPSSALFARIQQMVNERGVDIRQSLSGNALKLEFADGQRILINFDALTRNVWLAARSGGIEFVHRDGTWRTHDQSELFNRLRELIEQTISSNPLNARAQQPVRPEPVVYYQTKERHGIRNVLIVLLAGLIGFWAAQQSSRPPQVSLGGKQPQTVSLNKSVEGLPCESGFPANGNVTIFANTT